MDSFDNVKIVGVYSVIIWETSGKHHVVVIDASRILYEAVFDKSTGVFQVVGLYTEQYLPMGNLQIPNDPCKKNLWVSTKAWRDEFSPEASKRQEVKEVIARNIALSLGTIYAIGIVVNLALAENPALDVYSIFIVSAGCFFIIASALNKKDTFTTRLSTFIAVGMLLFAAFLIGVQHSAQINLFL